jgi:hypothetical protein
VEIARIREHLLQTRDEQVAVISPLIGIGGSDEIHQLRPILLLDRRDQVHAVQTHLLLGLPESEKVEPENDCEQQPRIEPVPKNGPDVSDHVFGASCFRVHQRTFGIFSRINRGGWRIFRL